MLSNVSEDEKIKYSVGALLYSPANCGKIIKQIDEMKISPPYSAALCLEDAIGDAPLDEAEAILLKNLAVLKEMKDKGEKYIPDIFIRVRKPSQVGDIYKRAKENSSVIKGFIFPKYTLDNAEGYNASIKEVNAKADRKVYMMPILETADIITAAERRKRLADIKDMIDDVGEYVLNVRVGGNDFCNCFALRRGINQTIYDICTVRDCIADILTVFLSDYALSAPVWEYFGDADDPLWRRGMLRELELDRLNGFVGKTVIHPVQVALVNESLKVSLQDKEDALSIVNWDHSAVGVEKGSFGGRMNEVKCHTRWAKKILMLADIYGVKGENT